MTAFAPSGSNTTPAAALEFRVTARMILELGAELISSDAVAIYELVKNAVDAASPTVAVSVEVSLKRTDHELALELARGEPDLEEVVAFVRDRLLQAKDPAPALAYEAALREAIAVAEGAGPDDRIVEAGRRARLIEALSSCYARHNVVRIADKGHGMTAGALAENFLTIGTRSRRREKVDAQGRVIVSGRPPLGDKGVGRLSAMRLGDQLSVATTTAGSPTTATLTIDWTRFSHQSDALIGDVPVAPVTSSAAEPATQGTTIEIRDLRGDWDEGVFKQMVDVEFSRISDPFAEPTTAGPDAAGPATPDSEDPGLFDLSFNGSRFEIPTIPKRLLEQAHAVVSARYGQDPNGEPSFEGTIDYRLRGRSTSFKLREADLISLTDPIADRRLRTSAARLRELGAFEVSFHWYNRRLLKEVAGLGTRAVVIEMVNEWAGGLMVFRNGFRINPYGSRNDDWLALDKKALGARGYKVNRSQIIGRVELGAHNDVLVEQTNREGLAENDYKQLLVGMLRHLMITEFRSFIDEVDRKRRVSDETTVDELGERIESKRAEVLTRMRDLAKAAPANAAEIERIEAMVAQLVEMVDEAKQMSQEFEEDRAKFVHLAGIGLMVEYVLHEIGRASARALDALAGLGRERLDASARASLVTLEGQMTTLKKRVDVLDPLGSARRQVKETFDLADLLRTIVSGREPQFARHRIAVTLELPPRPMRIKAVKGMVIQIVENLLENSIYWLDLEHRRTRGFKAELRVVLDGAAKEVTVADNGPGVPKERAEAIFEAYVTAKPPGQGKGLGLYISREIAKYHDWRLSMSEAEDVKQGQKNAFVLELEPGP